MSNDFDLLPSLAYAGSRLDRVGPRRGDREFIARAWAAPDARAYLLCNERVALSERDGKIEPTFPVADARRLAGDPEPVLLGLDGEAARFAVALSAEEAAGIEARADMMLTDLRTIAIKTLIAPEHLPALAAAKALIAWHARHRFCANCGAQSGATQGGWRRDCPACGAQHFPRTDPCVIMLAIDGERCLLGRQARFPTGMWSCLAGFAEPGENIEDAVRRETAEETGVTVKRVRYFASQPWPFPMSLMIGCHAEAVSTSLAIDRSELEGARWVAREEVALMLGRNHPDGLFVPPPLAIAHHLIRAYVERGPAIYRLR